MSEACPPRAPRTRMSERDMMVERRIRSAGREGEQSRRGFALTPRSAVDSRRMLAARSISRSHCPYPCPGIGGHPAAAGRAHTGEGYVLSLSECSASLLLPTTTISSQFVQFPALLLREMVSTGDSNLVHRTLRFANRLPPTMVTAGSTVRARAAANGLVGFRRGSTGVWRAHGLFPGSYLASQGVVIMCYLLSARLANSDPQRSRAQILHQFDVAGKEERTGEQVWC
ncbi:hypothetical protein B0H13DRAFT_1883216 [Mycena leptocephala]|nr:hypothetical protein B0H13DRAFT_1883216 [Mycena leptocephala]